MCVAVTSRLHKLAKHPARHGSFLGASTPWRTVSFAWECSTLKTAIQKLSTTFLQTTLSSERVATRVFRSVWPQFASSWNLDEPNSETVTATNSFGKRRPVMIVSAMVMLPQDTECNSTAQHDWRKQMDNMTRAHKTSATNQRKN